MPLAFSPTRWRSHAVFLFPSFYSLPPAVYDADCEFLSSQAVLARVSALQLAQKEKKPAPEKKLRGKKAKKAADESA